MATDTMTDAPERALAVYEPRTALEVDDKEAAAKAAQIMKHKGAGLFPDNMSEAQAAQIARIALAHHLDPFMGDIILYQGRPYVTIDGRIRSANQHPAFEGMECSPATDAERKAFRCKDDEHLWVTRVWRRDRRVPIVGYGRAHAGDGNPVSAKWAQEMAQKRSKHRALRDAFSVALAGLEEVEGYEQPAQRHGEIIEGEVVRGGPIRGDQVTAIHTLVGKFGWSDAEYRGVLRKMFDVASSKDLTEGKAAAVLEAFHSIDEHNNADAFVARIRKGLADDADEYERERAHDLRRDDMADVVDADDGSWREVDEPATSPETETDTPRKPSKEDVQGYVALMNEASSLGMDLAEWELSGTVTSTQLETMHERLAAAIQRQREAQGQLI